MNVLASLGKLGQRKFGVFALSVGMAASGTMVWTASNAAFTASTTNGSNSWTTGTMALTDDDSAAMFANLTILPGQSGERCIRVTYNGSNATNPVKIHANLTANQAGGGGVTIGDKIQLTIQSAASTQTAAFADGSPCTGTFGGPTTLYPTGGTPAQDTVYEFADAGAGNYNSYANGLSTGWTPTNGQVKVFKFSWSLLSSTDDTFQNKNCAVTFTFETQT